MSPFFDSRYYYQASPDVRNAGLEPILHYLEHGWQETRSPSPYFDAIGFLKAHPNYGNQQNDLAEICVRLYGSYSWSVDGEIVPALDSDAPCIGKALDFREQRRLLGTWQRYRNFFDADFYQREYPEAASTAEDSFAHYMHRGYSEDRNPREDFDGYRYRKAHGLSRGQNPFRHCLDRLGPNEPFPSNSKTKSLPENFSINDDQLRGNDNRPDEGAIGNPLTLCIHVHCFYIDLLPETADLLRDITLPFSLIVTVCSELDAAKANVVLAEVSFRHHVQVLVVENRGRDIAPFLLDASPMWRKSDLVLHLHTKKSTHVTWGDNWRRYLLAQTIGNEKILERVVNCFHHDPKLGLIYPENYCMIRHFTEREQNVEAIVSVAAKIGLTQDFLSLHCYPAGSMAFYRVAALEKTLNFGGLEALFEQELGQLDGTSAHALERLLPEAIRQSGYRTTSYCD